MMFIGVGVVVALSIVLGAVLKAVAPKVGIVFWIACSLGAILLVIATVIRIT